ncbi:cytochrome P450 [Kitasatospora sp. NBC_01287]|uniref:cytochrome P450 n=1 Tax=Kitasatospora sp. NBC_01287 TaxID=2903573 RepID=UPI0022561C78|nr:cytochrome P450 [Kitasatospora sp. NBC_01287]MCX4744832.1 cytochrome P450 [Kitasatospora sp. NBC_01287]
MGADPGESGEERADGHADGRVDGRAVERAEQTPEVTPEQLLALLGTPEGRADPYPVYRRLRALAPACRTARGQVYLTGHQDCADLVRDPAFRAQGPDWMDRVSPGWRERPGKVATIEAMLFRDPPDHTRLRRLVSGAFTARRLAALTPEVERLARRALDGLAEAGADGGTVDLQALLARSLPVSVIGTLVGVPEADWGLLQDSMSAMMQVVELTVDEAALAAADRGAEVLMKYFAELVAERRARPTEDLASALVAIRDTDGGLSEEELLQTLLLLFMAGVDTMVNHLVNATAAFLDHPEQAQLLRTEPALGPGAVEEALRYDPPIQILARVAGQDLTIGGAEVAAGSLVVGLLGAAGRDPARYPDPERFDITRTGAASVAFGGGMHHCLGAPLARIESAAFLPGLLTRFPGLRPAGPAVRRGMVLRGFAQFPVAIR